MPKYETPALSEIDKALYCPKSIANGDDIYMIIDGYGPDDS